MLYDWNRSLTVATRGIVAGATLASGAALLQLHSPTAAKTIKPTVEHRCMANPVMAFWPYQPSRRFQKLAEAHLRTEFGANLLVFHRHATIDDNVFDDPRIAVDQPVEVKALHRSPFDPFEVL